MQGKDPQLFFILSLVTIMGLVTAVWYIQTKGLNLSQYQLSLPKKENPLETVTPGNLKLQSPSFSQGQQIPADYTCKGKNVNPPLEIFNAPSGTASFLLVVDDPDAPVKVFDHWIVFNINPKTTFIAENSVPEGAVLGQNSVGKGTYEGPCPPLGKHTYRFKLYALDVMLDLPAGADKAGIAKKAAGHILDKAELIGTFGN